MLEPILFFGSIVAIPAVWFYPQIMLWWWTYPAAWLVKWSNTWVEI